MQLVHLHVHQSIAIYCGLVCPERPVFHTWDFRPFVNSFFTSGEQDTHLQWGPPLFRALRKLKVSFDAFLTTDLDAERCVWKAWKTVPSCSVWRCANMVSSLAHFSAMAGEGTQLACRHGTNSDMWKAHHHNHRSSFALFPAIKEKIKQNEFYLISEHNKSIWGHFHLCLIVSRDVTADYNPCLLPIWSFVLTGRELSQIRVVLLISLPSKEVVISAIYSLHMSLSFMWSLPPPWILWIQRPEQQRAKKNCGRGRKLFHSRVGQMKIHKLRRVARLIWTHYGHPWKAQWWLVMTISKSCAGGAFITLGLLFQDRSLGTSENAQHATEWSAETLQ